MSALIKKILVFAVIFFPVTSSVSGQSYKQGLKLARFIDYIENYYVDSVNSEKLVEDAIQSVLLELDPHSTYIPADELKRMREPLEGNFEGIGISFSIMKDTLYVISPIAGGPSEKVGIQAGDKIIKVNDENVAGVGLTNERVFELLRGKKGTKVTVTVLRHNEKKPVDFNIVRDKIPIYSIDASYMINPNTGYIKINSFSATTVEEFQKAAADLKKQKAENLILDLTNNGGGYMDAAVKLSDEFLQQGALIVYTQGKNNPRRDYIATQNGVFEKGKVIVLINEGSASASEILSGAVQDWDRGLIIGRRSFGKGLVQREMPLPDESAIRLTIAKYYTPSGRLIQKPFEEGIEKYELEVFERFSNGQLQTTDSITLPDSLKYSTLKKGRTVYGGGGIMPDVFVALDTSFYNTYYRDLIRKGIVNRFALEYVDKNRQKIQKNFPTFESYKKDFKVDEGIFKEFRLLAAREQVTATPEEENIAGKQLEVLIKAMIARDVYGNNEFFQVYNTTNNIYLKAIEVINNWEQYQAELQ